jgi:acetyl-CoA carboxylase carboxyltransferase component
MAFEKQMEEWARRRQRALEMGGAEKVTRHHARGRLIARERIERLLDTNSFVELGMFNHSDGNPRSFACNEIS